MEVDHTRKILGKDYNPSIMDVKEEGWERTKLCPSIFLTPCISPPEKKVSSSLVNECHGLFFFFFCLLQRQSCETKYLATLQPGTYITLHAHKHKCCANPLSPSFLTPLLSISIPASLRYPKFPADC